MIQKGLSIVRYEKPFAYLLYAKQMLKVEAVITPHTTVIMPVLVNGTPCGYEALQKDCEYV